MLYPQRTAYNARVNPAFGMGLGLGSALQGAIDVPLIGNIILEDFFHDANGTALTAHAPNVGPAWAAITGTFVIQGNAVQPNSGNNADQSVLDAGVSNGLLFVNLVPQTDGTNYSTPGVILRGSDSTHYWASFLSAAPQNNFTLYENTGSGLALRALSTVPVVAGTTYDLAFLLTDNVIASAFAGAGFGGAGGWQYVGANSNQNATKFGIILQVVGTPPTPCSWVELFMED